MIELMAQFQRELVSLAFSLLAAFIVWLVRPKTRLIWSVPHVFTFDIPTEKPFNVETGSIFIQNIGRRYATQVEVTFNWRPQNFSVWPPRRYEAVLNQDERFVVKVDNLAPRESMQIELLATGTASNGNQCAFCRSSGQASHNGAAESVAAVDSGVFFDFALPRCSGSSVHRDNSDSAGYLGSAREPLERIAGADVD